MKARLIKKDGHYDLYVESIGLYTSTYQWTTNGNLLSIENCQAIERGYYLDELAKNYLLNKWLPNTNQEDRELWYLTNDWSKGVVTIIKNFHIELMGDKKFTEGDIIKAMESMANLLPLSMIDNYVQSLQQTEWDVEIVEEPADLAFYESGNRFPIDANLPDRFKYKPKLDADECLILKTI